jgi:ATP-binding cassette subfamily B protein
VSEWKKRFAALRNVPLVLGLMYRAGPRLTVLAAGARVVAALVPLAILFVGRRIVDLTVDVVAHDARAPAVLWQLVGVELALAGFGLLLGRLIAYADFLLAERFSLHVSVRVMRHAARLDLASFEEPAFYDKLARARLQALDRVGMLRAIGGLTQQIIMVASLAIAISTVSIWCFLLIGACLLPAFLVDSHYAFKAYSLRTSQTPARRQLDYLRFLGASREAAQEVKLFQLGEHFVSRYAEISSELLEADRRLQGKRLAVGALLSLLGACGQYGAYALALFDTVHNGLSVGTFTFLVGAIAATTNGIQSVFDTFSGIADQALFVTDLREFLAVTPSIQSKPSARKLPRPIRKGFVMEDLTFIYPGQTLPVLDRLSVELRAGERVALVGENGQGKTTLVKLLMRLYAPTSGRILLDGVDLADYDLDDLHAQVSVIFQDFVRYQMTLAHNIGLGNVDRMADRDAIVRAGERSLADGLARKWPAGYDQLLGRMFEGGVDLSGGEWQKVALARAYLRDAQLLVLDEPTAALDANAEREVFLRFADLTAGRMALFISHRFSTVRMADRILVLEAGRITEDGAHKDLIAAGGRYSQLFELQAASYR